ncbi:MAG: amino acid ABC transporter substrate-binding protein [Psychromonas sp.]|nr:amino acid ABC transporter substrate-binding protein [Psychromonas sp.]
MPIKKWGALLLLLICPPLFSTPKIVTVATLNDYAPLVFSLDNQIIRTTLKPGEDSPLLYGYSWDVFRESFHNMGYTIQLKVSPWARALKELEAGEVDLLFPAGKNKSRLTKFNYSQQAVNAARFVIYINATNPLQWNGAQSIKGLNIGVIRSFNYGHKWSEIEGVNKININRIITGFEMLAKGRLHGFIGYEFNWDHHLKVQGWTNKFRKLTSFDQTNEYVVTLKSNKQGKKLLNDFDLGKQKLIYNGHLQALQLKWGLK